MANTGIKTVLTLRKYVDGVATSETKANVLGDPDYIAPYEDLVDCPVEGSTTTSTTITTTTTDPTTTTTTEPTTTTTTVASCTCVTVDVLNTQLQSGGLDLYFIYNNCSGQEESVNLFESIVSEQNGSTYFGLCKSGSGSNMFKYGVSGDPFVGLEGMNTNPSITPCSVDEDCSPVLP